MITKSRVLVNNVFLSNITKDKFVKSCMTQDRANYLNKKQVSEEHQSDLQKRKEDSLYLKHLSYLSRMITEHIEDRKAKSTIIYEYKKDNVTIIEVVSDDIDSLEDIRTEIKKDVPEFKELITFRVGSNSHIYVNEKVSQRIRFFGKKHKFQSV